MNWELIDRYGWRMLEGLGTTLQLVALALSIGLVLAVLLALMRLSKNPLLGGFSFGYSYFFRGTPLLAQVFLIYYGAPQFKANLEAIGLWPVFREAFYCALIAFSLNTAAYQSEIFRGAIKAVPKGQLEAASSLGMTRLAIYLRIIAPQAALIALRPFGNEVILMIKGSAVASVVTIYDLLGTAKLAFNRSFDFQAYVWAAIMYLIIVETVRRTWDRLERLMTRHLKPLTKTAQAEALQGTPQPIVVKS